MTVREITELLEGAGIEHYSLVHNQTERKVTINSKEDFDSLLDDLQTEAFMFNPKLYGVPPFAGKIAFFDYQGWKICGLIANSRNDDSQPVSLMLEGDYDTY
jgi:hypothetical protein